MKPLISIVVPMYNEAANVKPLLVALSQTAADCTGYQFEFVCVNDGSPDETYAVLAALRSGEHRLVVVDLARNFGKELAMSAGLEHARGAAVVFLDADLQHPPRLIPEFIAQWEKGADVVIGIRNKTEKKSLLRRAGSFVFRALMRLLSPGQSADESTDFRLLDRKVADALLAVGERERLFRGLVDWLGFRRVSVPFDAPSRLDATPSRFTFFRLLDMAINAAVSNSARPLRFLVGVGAFISLSCFFLLIWMLTAQTFVSPRFYYTPLAQFVVFNTMLSGVVLLSLGVVALYIAKIQSEVTRRPLYVVREVLRADGSKGAL